jgi:hypothetical protein
VLDAARGEIGYKALEDPERGSKYGRWMAELTGEDWLAGPSTSIWWCCIFASWCLAQAGQECTGFPSYNTDTTLGKGPQLVAREDVQPGDLIVWDWNADGATDHIGIVEQHEQGALGTLVTIEGNYSNSVARVDRSNSWGMVAACIRPPYDSAAKVEAQDTSRAKLDVDGVMGTLTIKALQSWLTDEGYYHGLIDGVIDTPTSLTVKALQARLNDTI